ncbi:MULTISPECIES: molybdopterin-dependent oxidoreductase [unclassified Polaromonas]|uniref:SorA family sulfite dehydrogenase catalytic subunit n=1 Tax=unclassified Polaromonas TaxID=2638319 RepID=UPI000F097039|nr:MULTISPECIES: molybdopterin-dependent oxidoreductase [unclassified Polaromonas]AYQ30213.1 oxidase [Polaromonas sp. SP1]QGJ18671.1 molybdopterin-dependent oxidoreductase [Polaromonas sp. Pch-P]
MNHRDDHDARRRQFLQRAGFGAAALGGLPLEGFARGRETLPFGNGERELVTYPGKRPLLRVTTRPPHLETPFSAFSEGAITPNNAFFVRYHLANIPKRIDASTYRLRVGGHVKQSLSLSLAELKALAAPVEVVAVNQCSGNSRGFFEPRVFGAQLGNGSMGNARWVGVPLRAVLEKAGVLPGAKQVALNGLDTPVLPQTPDFIKALNIDLALSAEPIVAWSMNGADIPFLNGYPIKLIVPGYFGTYWVKHLSEIVVMDHNFEGFFMSTAYRVPDNDCHCVPAGTAPTATRPLTTLPVRSFITSVAGGARLPVGKPAQLKGIAFDGGSGIRKVEVSEDGQQWREAVLGKDLGRFSFREWRFDMTPQRKGEFKLMVRATNMQGDVQPATATWNPGGYARNVIETTRLVAV